MKNILRFVVLQFGLFICQTSSGVNFTITPSTTSNTYIGTITLQITGLTNGEAVTFQKFMDVNTNGVIDAADILVQQFQLTDGLASVFSGVTNINVPRDTDTTGGQITTVLNFPNGDVSQNLTGKYAYKLSSPTGHFTPITNLFTITNTTYSQSFTGAVRNNGTNVPNALVLLFIPSNDGGQNAQSGAVADNLGNYILRAPAGSGYALIAFKSNFVSDATGAANLALGSGATVTTNLNLTTATQSISAKIVDANNSNVGLPGMLVPFQTTNNLITISFTDTNGNVTGRTTANGWKVGGNSGGSSFHGYIGLRQSQRVDTSTGSVAGVTVALPKAAAIFYGNVKDDLNHPVPGVKLFSEDNNNLYEDNPQTDINGNYVAGALAGTWQVDVDNNNPTLTNYVISSGQGQVSLSSGQAYLQNFVVKLASNHITGYVRDNNNVPIAGVQVSANATLNGTNFQTANVITDTNGNYSLNVPNGNWNVSVSCNGGNNSLSSLGSYECPDSQLVNIGGGNGVANFVAQLCNGVSITTTSLPGGQTTNYYYVQLDASSCQSSFTWSLSASSASLPPGLSLDSSGELQGTPQQSGTFNFSVHVVDGNNNTADQALQLVVTGAAVQVTTTSLPNGTNGAYYSQQLTATDGQLPYSWSLAPGSASLPANLSLGTNGIISGTAMTNGTFYFYVRVTDGAAATSDQPLSLTIVSPALHINTVSLPGGTVGVSYNTSLQATGGQHPYNWSMAPGSASLPSNLTLAANGTISGMPNVSGTNFQFIVQVTDGASTTLQGVLSMTIAASANTPPLTLNAPHRLANGQFEFSFNTAPGLNYTIQSATNLNNWTSVLTLGGSGNPLTITDPGAGGTGQRFYRVKIGP